MNLAGTPMHIDQKITVSDIEAMRIVVRDVKPGDRFGHQCTDFQNIFRTLGKTSSSEWNRRGLFSSELTATDVLQIVEDIGLRMSLAEWYYCSDLDDELEIKETFWGCSARLLHPTASDSGGRDVLYCGDSARTFEGAVLDALLVYCATVLPK